MLKFLLVLIALALVSACSTPVERDASIAPQAWKIETGTACIARGGAWTQLGRAPVKQCLLQTSDAGKACTDGSDCEGLCLAKDGTTDGARTAGACSVDTNTFGCSTRLRDGVATTLCVD